MWMAAHSDAPFYSERFSAHGETFCYVKIDGTVDLSGNPPATVLSGPIGTSPAGWPSAFRGTPPLPPAHLDLREEIKPIEQHGFVIADFSPERIVLRFFKWDVKTERPEAIDHLEPFHTMELHR